jgi:hypothetical protein
MHSHSNACMAMTGGLWLNDQDLLHQRPLAELVSKAGISLSFACNWLARYRSGGSAPMADRRSVLRTQRRTLESNRLQQAV